MATKNSVQYAKEVTVPITMQRPDEIRGRVRVARAHYVCSGFNQNDVLNLFTMPPKAYVVGGFMETDNLATSTTIALGYSGTADAILAATATATAAKIDLPKQAAIGLECGGKVIQATLGGANATDNKILDVVLFYVTD